MRTTYHIANSHREEMDLVLRFIENFDVHQLLYAINGKQFREEDIVRITLEIKDYHNKLERQKFHLETFGKTFNNEYTTDDNKCFDTSMRLARKMRSGLTGIKKAIIKPFVKISRKRLPNGMPNPSIMERSMISTNNYCADLYGLSSYPDSVVNLFTTMLQFYELLDECIAVCKHVLEEEKVVKASDKLCLERLVKALEKSRKNQLHIIEAAKNDPALKDALMHSQHLSGDTENPVLSEYKKDSKFGFPRKYFHNCSHSDIGKITLYKVLNGAGDDPMLVKARAVFGYNDEKIARINYIIAHFDEILPPICKRQKIPAYELYVFMEWCGEVISIESFLDYFSNYYLAHGGKWKVISKSAIQGAKNRPIKDKKNNSQYEQIRKNVYASIERLLSEMNAQNSSD